MVSLVTHDSVPTHQLSIWSTVKIATSGLVSVFCLVLGIVQLTIAADDSYIAGYAAAVLEHEFNVPGAIVQVHEGVVVLTAGSLGKVDRPKVITALEKIPGVVRAEVREDAEPSAVPADSSQPAIQQALPKPESKFLPRGLLVAPFHADPRWPHFSMASRHVSFGQEPGNTGSANFGETLGLYRNAATLNGQWELALQAGVFSVFNMNAPSGSLDLVNADYTVGLLASYRTGRLSGFLRLRHQSSHLGDEFILNSQTPVNRVNLSFEEVDLKLSYDVASWFRIYGGGGMLVGRDPKDLNAARANWELSLPAPGPCGTARFVPSPMWMPRRMREVIGRLPIPSRRGFNSRMRESEIGSYSYWRNISAALRLTGNFMLKTPSGSDLVSTCISDAQSFVSLCWAR